MSKPVPPNTLVVKMRLDINVKEAIEEIARIEHRTFAAQCGLWLEERLSEWQKGEE